MNKILQPVIEKAEVLCEADQRELAHSIEHFIAARAARSTPLSDEDRAAIIEALDEVERGEFATEAEIDAVLRRPWK